jgi:DNA-directed RNA polymerase subunit RPC12/RpoP
MEKRFTFRCWQCSRTYTLFREITTEQTLTVACPYCHAEGVVDLQPYRQAKKSVMRGDKESEPELCEELELPDVLPTQQPK